MVNQIHAGAAGALLRPSRVADLSADGWTWGSARQALSRARQLGVNVFVVVACVAVLTMSLSSC